MGLVPYTQWLEVTLLITLEKKMNFTDPQFPRGKNELYGTAAPAPSILTGRYRNLKEKTQESSEETN